MPPKKKSTAKQSSLLSANFWPLLPKPAIAIGKFVSVIGGFWSGCPAADKDERFQCSIIEFVAMHDFGGRKGAGFMLKEMGQDGRGSLEPGVASGSEFVMAYPLPFLEYYWFANRDELEPAVRTKLFPADGAQAGSSADVPDSMVDAADAADVKTEKVRAPIFDYLEEVSRKLNPVGPKRGTWTVKYQCSILVCSGKCGGAVTTYATGDEKSETTSNAWTHLRLKAKYDMKTGVYGEGGCPQHKEVLMELNKTNKKLIQLNDGEMVPVMSFEEAFPHHVDYVWCRARGIFGARVGSKPLFRKYVRGYEPRAVFPHEEVQFNIAICIKELRDEEQYARHQALQKEFKGRPCIGIQLDMWTNGDTHIAYGGVNAVSVREPRVFTAGSTGKVSPNPKHPQLRAVSEVLDFEVFPDTQHTKEAICNWFTNVMKKKGIEMASTSGITPDGASDGQAGLRLVDDAGVKVDTCTLHGLQSSLLWSVGLNGVTSKNPEAKSHLKLHNRISSLNSQTRAVSDGIRKTQVDAGIPFSKILTTVTTSRTRWGNQSEQVVRNNLLRPVIDPVVDSYKRVNRNKPDAVVEDDDSNPTSRVGKAVPASALGLTADDWDKSLEMKAFLDHPWQIKETIEHKGYVTGATALYLLYDLSRGCSAGKSLIVKLHPSTAKLEDRIRQVETRTPDMLCDFTKKAREIMVDELTGRFFAERPSDTRLVQIWMSKQYPAQKWLPLSWQTLSKSLYLTMLRDAVRITGMPTRSSPRKQQKTQAASSALVRNQSDDEDADADSTADSTDPVTDEAERWAKLDKKTISEFTDDAGIVNEFALMYHVRSAFPLHYTVFRQTASHLPHEGNSEQLFSRSGALSHSNGKMDPSKLAVWTSIGVNYSIYQPSHEQIMAHYLLKFSKGGSASSLHEDDLGLVLGDGDASEGGEYYVQPSDQ